MKIKPFILPIVVFFFGIAANIIGAIFKIQHWPYSDVLLTIGLFAEVLSILLFISILARQFFKSKK